MHLIVRAGDLNGTMSDYLIQRIAAAPNIVLRPNCQIQSLHGAEWLESVTIKNSCCGDEETLEVCGLFVMIGATPNTEWLGADVDTDSAGFIRTGTVADGTTVHVTSLPGVFAVGDVRLGSIKRVASAVGEGSVVVAEIHRYLSGLKVAEFANTPSQPRNSPIADEIQSEDGVISCP